MFNKKKYRFYYYSDFLAPQTTIMLKIFIGKRAESSDLLK